MPDPRPPGTPGPGPAGGAIRLASDNLLSRYGFEDGSSPDVWLDHFARRGTGEIPDFPWAEVVRRYLLPSLDQRVTVTEWMSHNPIRATAVDGVDVTECWTGDQPWPDLTPNCVDVPLAGVLALAGDPERGGRAPRGNAQLQADPTANSSGRRQPVRTSRKQRRGS